MIKYAVIFDMNGVVVDDTSYHEHAWRVFCDRHSKTLSDKELERYVIGRTNPSILKYLFGEDISEQDIAFYTEEKETLYREIYFPHLKPLDGLYDFLFALKKHNIPTAIATSSPPICVDFVIDNLSIRSFFDAIVDATQVTKGKPDPEIYLKAARQIDTDPALCIGFEDSLSGIKALGRAGMKTIGVATSHKQEELRKYTDMVIDDFSCITIDMLSDILSK